MLENISFSEAATQKGSLKNMLCKYAVNILENTHTEVWFQ